MAHPHPDTTPGHGSRSVTSALLVAFAAVCVVLIVLIWGENISGGEPGQPSFYRDTFVIDDSYRATATAEAQRTGP